MTSDSGLTSTTLARYTSTSCMTWVRASPVADTLTSARSREIDGAAVMFSTRRTGTSFVRWASRRRAPYSSVSTTTVILDMPAVWVRPTVSDSMLNARRRKSDDTRFNTPGLLST